jgi:hypothetical protein
MHARRSGGSDHRVTSDLFGIFLSACNENQNYAHWELFGGQYCLYLKLNTLSSFHIEGLHLSSSTLSDLCESTRAISTIDYHSQRSVIHSHLIYPTHNASLLSMIFTSVRLLYLIMSYDHSTFVIELNEFDRSRIRESRNVNISIC